MWEKYGRGKTSFTNPFVVWRKKDAEGRYEYVAAREKEPNREPSCSGLSTMEEAIDHLKWCEEQCEENQENQD